MKLSTKQLTKGNHASGKPSIATLESTGNVLADKKKQQVALVYSKPIKSMQQVDKKKGEYYEKKSKKVQNKANQLRTLPTIFKMAKEISM